MGPLTRSDGRRYTLELGDLRFEVDPAAGGRITSFCCRDVDVLCGPSVDPRNYGSTLWTSPQSDWGWPPPPEFDDVPYAISASAGALVLTGPTILSLGVRLEKRFALDPAKRAVSITYSIHNESPVTRVYAPWEVSRVPPGGLTFFPTGARQAGPLAVELCTGATWYRHVPDTLDDVGQKHSADGTKGYVAHAAQGILFLKSFADLGPEEQAPGEGEVEVYGNCRYVEVEAQGPYAAIPPSGVAVWEITWYAERLAAGTEIAVGSLGLLEQAASLAGR